VLSPGESIARVAIDIDHAKINPRAKGVITVAILGSPVLDVTTIDVTTVGFGVGENTAMPAHSGHVSDVNGDGIDDLLLHFRISELGLDSTNPGDAVEIKLVGETSDGVTILGADTAKVVPKGKKS